MARRSRPKRRKTIPDRKFGNLMVSRLISKIMSDGRRSTAENVVYGAFDIIAEKTGKDPVSVFNRAMKNVRPVLKVKSRRVGGSTYQVPVEVRSGERDSIAIRWIVDYAKARRGKSTAEKLAAELLDAAQGEATGSVKKKEDTHKMAEANKAFAHYRW
ncbi:30S ribosomal protein S7 [Candidatus Fermentibacteria bacterium]|nr:30S ribosomal protein S7 [Candidatus Fermentibacteria bacterium]